MADNPFLGSANPQQFIQQQQILPPEMQQESRDISRQQRLADMLQGQAFNQPQGQMVSGRYVAPSFFQNVLPLAQAFAGNVVNERAGAKQVALAQGLRERQVKDAELFSEAMSGVPADPNTGRAAIAPDYKAAVRIALNSYDPAIRAEGLSMMKGMKLGEGETFQRMNFGSGKMETVASGGVKMPDTVKTAAMTLGITTDPSTWTPQQTEAVAKQVMAHKNASASNSTVHINNFEPFADAAQKDAAKILGADQTRLESAPDKIRNLDTVMTTLKNNPTFVGPQGSNLTAIASYANKYFGANIPPDKIADTAFIKNVMTQIATARLKQSDPNPTEKQMGLMLQTIGSIDTDPNALYKLAQQERDAIVNSVTRHNDRVTEAEKRAKNGFVFNYKVEVPKTSTTPAPAGVSQQQWDVMTPDQRKLFGG